MGNEIIRRTATLAVAAVIILAIGCGNKSAASCGGCGTSQEGIRVVSSGAFTELVAGTLSPSSDLDQILEYAQKQERELWGFHDNAFLFEEFVLFARDVAGLYGPKPKTVSELAALGWLPFVPKGEIPDFATREARLEACRFTGLEEGCEIALQKSNLLALYSSLLLHRVRFADMSEVELVYGKVIPGFFVNPLNGEAMTFFFGKVKEPVEPPFVSAGGASTGVGPLVLKTRCFSETIGVS